MPEYLYRIQPTRPEMLSAGSTPQEDIIVGQHFNYLQDLLASGTLILAGRTLNADPTSFGIVIFRAEDDAAAMDIVAADPAVRDGIFKSELYPYRVALIEARSA